MFAFFLVVSHSLRGCGSFLLLLRQPPRSPRVPYTTLFRSRARPRSRRPASRQPPLCDRRRRGLPPACVSDIRGGDRKSTRLNSSHLVISYAVFCLKKKKKSKADREGKKEETHQQYELELRT